MPASRDGWVVERLRPTWSLAALTAAGILTAVVLIGVFVSANRVLGWAVAAVVMAGLLGPPVRALDRFVPRALAVLITFVAVAAVGVGVGYTAWEGIRTQVDRLRDEAPVAAEGIEARDDRLGALARDIGLVDRVTKITEQLDEHIGTGGEALRSAAESIPPYFVSAVLTVFVLIFGPRIADGGLEQLRDARRRNRLRRALTDALHRSQAYVWAAIGQAALVGVTVWIGCLLLDVPAPTLIALIGALAALVPYLGIVLAWFPVVVLGLGVAPALQVLLAAGVAVGMQIVEAFWWRERIDEPTVHVGPVVPVGVGLLGYALYGLGGALYSAALAVFLLALADAVATGDDDIPTPVDDWPDGAPDAAGATD